MSGIPEGWLPVPFAVEPRVAHDVAAALLRESGAVAEEGADEVGVVENIVAALVRPPVTDAVGARLWHGFGVTATGVVADLSVEQRPTSPLDAAAGAGFAQFDVQRRELLDDGTSVTLAVVAPPFAAAADVAFLLRVQSPEAAMVRVVDILDRDLRAIGAVWDDAVVIARG